MDIDLENCAFEIMRISKETPLTIDQLIEVKKAYEMQRRNDLYVYNGETFDEQVAGFGEILKQFAERSFKY